MPSSHLNLVKKTPPTLRQGVYELYWAFASRRQEAFERRLSGAPWPWTTDRILQVYKFCNVFRAADRVSQYMIRDVAYADDPSTPADRIFQIVAFRTFSNIRTWRGLRCELRGAPTLDHLASGEFENALDLLKKEYGGLYTGAFILCANKAYGFDEKHRNHVGLFKDMFLERRLHDRIRAANSLEQVIGLLQDFPLMGPFMAYQTAIDLNYSAIMDFSENDYTQAGPGALRGLKKAFTDLNDYSPSETILWMTERQEAEFARLGLPFEGLFGRALHAIDCQGLFCELDKYCREAVPELLSNRSRIKARFTASQEPIKLFFPPKWQIHPWEANIPGYGEQDQLAMDFGTAEPRRVRRNEDRQLRF